MCFLDKNYVGICKEKKTTIGLASFYDIIVPKKGDNKFVCIV